MIILVSKKRAIICIVTFLTILTTLLTTIYKNINISTVSSDNVEVYNITIDDITIMNNQKQAELYPIIEVECSQKIKDGRVFVEGIEGDYSIKDNKITYLPDTIIQPNTEYTVTIEVKGYDDNEYYKKNWDFRTRELDTTEIWVEVSLNENDHRVFIRNKNKIIKEMVCSGGLEDQPTILGTYYLQNRGLEFYSERFNEGALYWVRIKDQFLFHSIPRDKNWNIIKEEEKKLGGPASHGCIRLSDEDAKWFYNNIPDGTMVIIHK